MKLTFENPEVSSFFNKQTEEAPVDVLKFIIENKAVFSFIDEVTSKLEYSAQKAKARNIRLHSYSQIQEKRNTFFILLHMGVKENDPEKFKEALFLLRDIYSMAESINNI